MKKPFDIIKKTIQILNSVSYENYSDGVAKNYLEYMEGSRADEDKLISPILLRKFLEEILGFALGRTIATQESKGVGKPDYIPVDTRTHPFVFDAKGTDTQNLSHHYSQIKKYIESHGLKQGILTNMRDLNVYTSEGIEIEKYNFNFVKLYRDYKRGLKICLEEENTKCFLNFIESFSYIPLTKEEKIERIAEAKPWSGREELNAKLLTGQLRHIVNILHNDVRRKKSELVSLAEAGEVPAELIAYEIENIASQVSGGEKKEVDSETFNQIMSAGEETSYGKAQDAFSRRVAYFAMTRLLLARVWEDIGFVEQSLYNGGFAKWYENFNNEIRRILHYAFDLSAERYPWLFKINNNYSWYEPSDEALIDSLYELSNFYLGKLDQDILGTIYEDYIERVDKKNKGQYYTPREIVNFIWDRVRYNNPKAFFWYIEGKRVPKFIFDPATGSGGFLVEAARRIRECTNFDWNDLQDLQDIHQAILWYIFGCEISAFPYYLTQVNLLIQLTPVIRRILELGGEKPRKEPTPLGIICKDSLELHNEELRLFPEEVKEEREEYEILHLPGVEKKIYDKIKNKLAGKFAYVCANPPYVGEKGHKKLFRSTIKSYPYWEKYYQGKMDYLHWFIILGLSKLREYGRLGFITSAYWPTADGASTLRKYILENAKIKEMLFFEGVKIFEHAKGQHNMVFVLTKCSGKDKKEERENNHIKIIRVKCKNQDLPGETIRENLDFLTKHVQKYIDKARYEDKYIKVFWSGVRQGELPKDGKAWNLMYSKIPKEILQTIQKKGEPLSNLCKVSVGTLTAADKVTRQNINWLTEEDIRKSTIKIDDGIFVLSENEYKSLNYHGKNIKPFFKNSDVAPYIIVPNEPSFFIYATNTIKDDPVCMSHLSKFENLLKHSKKVRGEEHIPWYELVRKKSPKLFEGPKIVTPNRSPKNTFGYSEQPYYGVSDVFVIVNKKETRESLKYILALLNSALLNFWTSNKNKRKGNVLEFVGTPLSQIPIYRIDFNNLEEVKLHDKIVEKVEAVRENMVKLANYSKYFKGIRLTKLEFDAPLPEANDEEIIKSIASKNLYNIRTYPGIKIEKPKGFEEGKFYLRKVKGPELILTGNAQLKLTGKGKLFLYITGAFEILKLLADVLSNWIDRSWIEIKENLLLPDNIISFNTQKTRILNNVQDVRAKILQLQKEINQIAYKLYRLNKEEIKTIEGTVK